MDPDTTLAALVSYGWRLVLHCRGCRAPKVTMTGPEIMQRFKGQLLVTVGEVCRRMVCRRCGGRGGWPNARACDTPEAQVSDAGRFNVWQSRDLYLRRLLAERGEPLEIADAVWADVEGALGDYHDWRPRVGAKPGYPLSKAAMRAAFALIEGSAAGGGKGG